MQDPTSTDSLMEFPCSFDIKAMGKADEGFALLVLDIVKRHAPEATEQSVRTRPSKGGKWLAVTVTIEATGKPQLDAIYQALTDHEKVVMAL